MDRHYETVCIVKPDVGDDVVKAIIEKAQATVTNDGGTVARFDDWGRRKLAYPIEKKNEGYYFVLTYTSGPGAGKEMERQFKLNEDVLRYQTIVLKELPQLPAQPEAPKAEQAEETAEVAEEKAEQAEEKATEGGSDE